VKPALDWISRAPIAHRGLHDAAQGRIENTRGAFVAAIEHGYAIELDVQLSEDGGAVVFHDDHLERLTTGAGDVSHETVKALAALSFRGGEGRIEPLADILGLVAGRTPLVVEIKSRFAGDMRLADRVIELVSDYAGPLLLKSFDPRIIIRLRERAPELTRGIVSMRDYGDDPETAHLSHEEMRSMTDLLHFAETEPDFISWYVEDLPCAQTFFSRAMLGRPVMTWTVRTPTQAALARAHADQMVFEGFLPE
jgi:glycerophosphoryl diester phosphodiesterase